MEFKDLLQATSSFSADKMGKLKNIKISVKIDTKNLPVEMRETGDLAGEITSAIEKILEKRKNIG